jgi:hypothetical protein
LTRMYQFGRYPSLERLYLRVKAMTMNSTESILHRRAAMASIYMPTGRFVTWAKYGSHLL